MRINLTKRLYILISILAIFIFMPGIAFATPVQINANSGIVFTQANGVVSNSASLLEINLTPQERQQLQAVRQRRNKEIKAVLNPSQRIQLAHSLRAGNDINQAVETLDLQPEQQNFIKAIVQLTNLKMKAILVKHSQTIGQ